jgi:hypothetical protein
MSRTNSSSCWNNIFLARRLPPTSPILHVIICAKLDRLSGFYCTMISLHNCVMHKPYHLKLLHLGHSRQLNRVQLFQLMVNNGVVRFAGSLGFGSASMLITLKLMIAEARFVLSCRQCPRCRCHVCVAATFYYFIDLTLLSTKCVP